MPTLAEIIFGVSFDVDDKQLSDAEKKADAAAKKVSDAWNTVANKTAAAGLAIAGVAAGMVGLATKAAGAGAAIDDAVKRAGVGSKEFQRLSYALEQSGGTSEGFANSLKFLSKSIVDARSGSGPAADALKKLGVSLAQLEGKTAEERFAVLADAFKGVDDAATKTDLALTIFGKAGGDLIPLLDEGAAGVKALGDQLVNMGGVMDEAAIAKAAEFDDQLGAVKKQLGAVVNEIGLKMIPIIQSAAKDWDKWAIAVGGVATAIGALKLAAFARDLGLVGSSLAAVNWAAGIAGAGALGFAFGTAIDQALGLSDAIAGVNVQARQMSKEQRDRQRAAPAVGLTPEENTRRAALMAERDAIMNGEFTDRGIDPIGQIDRELDGIRKASKDRKQGAAIIGAGGRIFDRIGSGFASGGFASRLGAELSIDAREAGGFVVDTATAATTKSAAERRKGGGKGTKKIDTSAFDALAGADLRNTAGRVGASEKALLAALEAGASSLAKGDSEGVARSAALGSLGSSVGLDLQTKMTDPILSSIFGENVPDIQLSSLARGAEPQVLISTINNTFNFDNDFQIDGAGDPRNVAASVVDEFRTTLQDAVDASTKTVKLGFAR